ncbi:hypothetical protein KDA00_03070 [Candidatus Saccharibacteria bacterium]|nr:hypothetical protein [Candidatus Saccharibacteria bacterium]
MSTNNYNRNNIAMIVISVLFIYIGAHALYNSGIVLNMNDFSLGLILIVLWSMALALYVNKLFVAHRANSEAGLKKGKKTGAKVKK